MMYIQRKNCVTVNVQWYKYIYLEREKRQKLHPSCSLSVTTNLVL